MINILIVEDDFRIANIHERFVKDIEGVKVIGQVHRAQDAVAFMEEHHVDLLLLDIYLPDKLGTELIKELKKTHNDLHFIVVTAADHVDLLDFSLKSGVFYYLIKPVSLEKFKDVIERFKRRQDLLSSRKSVDQELIDKLLGNPEPTGQMKNHSLPKGVNQLTLQNVLQILESLPDGITAEEMGEKLGASRTTARRYLEYLVSIGRVSAELEYGIVGRPERKYVHKPIK